MLFASCVKSRWLAVAVIAIAVFGFQSVVYAGAIPIFNANFTNDVLAVGDSVGGYPAVSSASNSVVSLSGWSFQSADPNGYNWASIWNPPATTTYTGYVGTETYPTYPGKVDNNGNVPGGTGPNVAVISVAGGVGIGAYLYQNLSTTVQASGTYTLTIACGRDQQFYSGYYGEDQEDLLIGITTSTLGYAHPLKETYVTAAELTGGQLTDFTATWTADGSHVGEALEVYMCNNGKYLSGDSTTWAPVDFANVRLDVTPEPGTLVLLATGLVGLVCYAWRKRR